MMGIEPTKPRLTPGSDEAIKQGCTCPIYDNAGGRGAWGSEGENAVFWVSGDCPLHAKQNDVDDDEKPVT